MGRREDLETCGGDGGKGDGDYSGFEVGGSELEGDRWWEESRRIVIESMGTTEPQLLL